MQVTLNKKKEKKITVGDAVSYTTETGEEMLGIVIALNSKNVTGETMYTVLNLITNYTIERYWTLKELIDARNLKFYTEAKDIQVFI